MAKIGPIKLKVDVKGAQAAVDVRYEVRFDAKDMASNQTYREECRIIGDDTNVGDPPEAGGDDTLGFLTPLFNKKTRSDGHDALPRHLTKSFRTAALNEDRGRITNPDELRAVVVLTPLPPATGKPVRRESPLVRKRI